MSEATLRQIMLRIESADKKSPIAVFRSDVRGKLNAVFADTAETKRLIHEKDKTHIGTYHKEMDRELIYKRLEGFINK